MPSFTSVNARVTELPVTPATARSLTVPGFVGGTVTVTAAAPLCPSLVAVIVAGPAATPAASPLLLTVATAVLELAQLTTRPLKALPFASLGIAVSCTVCPSATLAVVGLTATDATGTVVVVTVTAAVSANVPGLLCLAITR